MTTRACEQGGNTARRNVRLGSAWCGALPPITSAGEASRRTFSSVLAAKPVPSTRRVMISFSLSFTCAANKHCAYIGRKQSARLAAGQRSQRGVQGKQLAGGSVKGSIMSFLMQSLTHCVDTTMPAGTKRANMLQWHTRVLRPAKQRCGGPNGGPSGGGGGPMIALLRSRRHPRAATPPPGAHWRAAACSAGTCTCVARGEVQASDSASLLVAAARGCSRDASGSNRGTRLSFAIWPRRSFDSSSRVNLTCGWRNSLSTGAAP